MTETFNTNKQRILKFLAVGAIGVFINQGTLIFFHDLQNLSLAISSPIAIELSILSNFVLNNNWTWKNSKAKSITSRFINYHIVSLVSGLINYLVLIVLTKLGIHYFWANLAGIALAASINFILNHTWTFAEKLR